jgi:hypothetical protein
VSHYQKLKGQSKKAKGRSSQLLIKSGFRRPFAFDLFTFAFFFDPELLWELFRPFVRIMYGSRKLIVNS